MFYIHIENIENNSCLNCTGELGARKYLVKTLQKPKLASVYPWYTNTEQNGRKDKLNSSIHTRTLNIS